MAANNTIDAKLRIAADLADAVRSLKALQKELQATGAAAKAAGGDPSASRATTQAVRDQALAQKEAAAAARQAARDQVAAEREKAAAIRQTATEKKAADRAAAEADKQRLQDQRRIEREAAAARNAATKAARAESAKASQLAPQVTDIVTGLAGGQNPLLVAIQQGGQLRDIYGGVGNAAKALLGIFTPLRVAIGGVAGTVLALGVAYKQSREEGDRLNRAISSTGNLAATSQGQIANLAREIATRQKVSVGDVRETLTSLVESGQYTSQTLDVAARAVTTFSKATGQSSEEVIKSFDGMSNGVAKWAAKVNQQYGYLTAAEFERIRALESAGRTQEAVRLNLDLLAQTMQQRVIPQTNLLAGAWNVAAAAAGSFWDSLKGLFRDETAAERISKLQKRLKELRDLLDKGGNTGIRKSKLLQDIADLEGKLGAEVNTSGRDAIRSVDASGAKQQAQSDIAARSAFEAENRTRQAVVQEGARKRAAYEQLMNAQIAEARRVGDLALEKDLTQKKGEYLAQQLETEKKQLRAFDSETTATRVAQARELYDKQSELLKDALARESKLNEQALQDGLIDVASYLAQRSQIERAQSEETVRELERRLASQRKVLAENTQRRGRAGSANEQEQFDEAILRTQEEIQRTEVQIVQAKRAANDEGREQLRLGDQYQKQLAETLKSIERRSAELSGTETEKDIRSRVADEFKPLIDQVRQLGGDLDSVYALMEKASKAEVFRKARSDFELLTQQVALQEQALDAQVEQGALTTEQAEQQKFDARARALPQLREMLDLLARLAQSPGDRLAVERLRQEVDGLGVQFTKLQQTMRAAIENGASTALQDYVTGVKSAKEATLDFMASILRAALNVITQRIGEKLADSLTVKGGGGGDSWLANIGTFVASLFHTGGVVGGGLQGMSRAVSPMLFATAARYHSGGMAGLAPDEVPAVLRKGEEVLTENDPRHRNNGGGARAIGNLNINVSVTGVDSTEGDQRALGNRLGSAVKAAVLTEITEQMRPGGLLSRR